MAVHVSLKIVLVPEGLSCSVAYDNTLACSSWHTEGNIFRIALLGRS